MRGRGERFFAFALIASCAAHALVPMLRGSPAEVDPDVVLEERIARTPMTVRFLTQEMMAPVAAPAPDAQQVLTSDAGERVIDLPPPAPTHLERRRDEPLPAPDLETETEQPPRLETEPVEVEVDMPERPQERETPPPEPATTPERRELPDVPSESPVVQEAQSGVTTKASPDERRNRPPNYPRRARAAGMQGRVEIEVSVGADGRVQRAEVSESSGHDLLDDEALKAVKRWRFTPARDASGGAVADTLIVPIEFDLKDR